MRGLKRPLLLTDEPKMSRTVKCIKLWVEKKMKVKKRFTVLRPPRGPSVNRTDMERFAKHVSTNLRRQGKKIASNPTTMSWMGQPLAPFYFLKLHVI